MPDDKERGLYRKYNVERVDGKPLKGGGALVLEFGDPQAWNAIEEYADRIRVSNPQFADDLRRLTQQQRNLHRAPDACGWCRGTGETRWATTQCGYCVGSGKDHEKLMAKILGGS